MQAQRRGRALGMGVRGKGESVGCDAKRVATPQVVARDAERRALSADESALIVVFEAAKLSEGLPEYVQHGPGDIVSIHERCAHIIDPRLRQQARDQS